MHLLNPLRHSQNFFLKSSLFSLEVTHLLVKSDCLSTHHSIMSVNLLYNSVQFVRESLPSVLALHGEDILEGFFLTSQNLYLLLMCVETFMKLSASLGQVSQLTLQVGSVLATLHLTSSTLS